ncbi:4Fe-4S binding protein [Desulfoferula mesophila]|jgi:pyruvate ferredoxin oxidoreductase delta subunit|uniref:Pyruvate synthase subunit PorD n=1 Tax=Desulfoferula mesophila TaxID=3058419 RepID=A0AAU9F1G0_9BACT|nr:pyruvate synthase subunit PorD [Desulfoferula mesophilus]
MADEGMFPWKDLPLGCAGTEPGSSRRFNTGDWRSRRYPVTDRETCIKCGLCWIICPDMAYSPDPKDEGYFTWDGYYCKGCGICIEECPKDAISWKEEKEEDKYGPACGA